MHQIRFPLVAGAPPQSLRPRCGSLSSAPQTIAVFKGRREGEGKGRGMEEKDRGGEGKEEVASCNLGLYLDPAVEDWENESYGRLEGQGWELGFGV